MAKASEKNLENEENRLVQIVSRLDELIDVIKSGITAKMAAPDRVHVTRPRMFYKPSLTKKEFKEDTIVSNIIKRFIQTGQMPIAERIGFETEFPLPKSYEEALEIQAKTDQAFAELPADLRYKLNNDPAQFLAFVQNPQNRAYLVQIGVMVDPNVPKPAPGEPVVLEKPAVDVKPTFPSEPPKSGA